MVHRTSYHDNYNILFPTPADEQFFEIVRMGKEKKNCEYCRIPNCFHSQPDTPHRGPFAGGIEFRKNVLQVACGASAPHSL